MFKVDSINVNLAVSHLKFWRNYVSV